MNKSLKVNLEEKFLVNESLFVKFNEQDIHETLIPQDSMSSFLFLRYIYFILFDSVINCRILKGNQKFVYRRSITLLLPTPLFYRHTLQTIHDEASCLKFG